MGNSIAEIIQRAWRHGLAVPSFNIPYLPMMAAVVRALHDAECFGLIAVARLEWVKFESGSLQAVAAEYARIQDARYTRLHLDHVPVIDEDQLQVDYLPIIADAMACGYHSVMVDGSRLTLETNIVATREVVEMAHVNRIPAEAELGAVLGHEAGPLPSYEELFTSGKGFTDPGEAQRFVQETRVDWLSVAFGNIHGAVAGAARNARKVEARLNIDHLKKIRDAVQIPLVLHGGSGIHKACVLDAIRSGIAKINVGTTIRQAYESRRGESIEAGQDATYHSVLRVIREELELAGSARLLNAME